MKKEITPKEALFLIQNLQKRLKSNVAGMFQNETQNADDFYISYNPNTDIGAETALCFKEGAERKFLILKGDYRDKYDVSKTLAENQQVFEFLVEQGAEVSPWSN